MRRRAGEGFIRVCRNGGAFTVVVTSQIDGDVFVTTSEGSHISVVAVFYLTLSLSFKLLFLFLPNAFVSTSMRAQSPSRTICSGWKSCDTRGVQSILGR